MLPVGLLPEFPPSSDPQTRGWQRDILSQPLRREGGESLSVGVGRGIGKMAACCLGLTRLFRSGNGERALSGSSGPMPVWRSREAPPREMSRRRGRTATAANHHVWPLGHQTVASLGQKSHRVSHLHFEIGQDQGLGLLARGIWTGGCILMPTAPEQD